MIMMTVAVYPLGDVHRRTSRASASYQVIPTSMAAVGITLSFVLTPVLGIAGPLIGVAFALVVSQLIPFDLHHPEQEAPGPSET